MGDDADHSPYSFCGVVDGNRDQADPVQIYLSAAVSNVDPVAGDVGSVYGITRCPYNSNHIRLELAVVFTVPPVGELLSVNVSEPEVVTTARFTMCPYT